MASQPPAATEGAGDILADTIMGLQEVSELLQESIVELQSDRVSSQKVR